MIAGPIHSKTLPPFTQAAAMSIQQSASGDSKKPATKQAKRLRHAGTIRKDVERAREIVDSILGEED